MTGKAVDPFAPLFVYGDLVRRLPNDGDYVIVEVSMGVGALGLPVHRHPNHSETVYVVSGTLAVEINGSAHALNAGEACTIAAGDPHTLKNGGQDLLKLIVVHAPRGLEHFYAEAGLDAFQDNAQAHSQTTDRKIWLVQNAERLGMPLVGG